MTDKKSFMRVALEPPKEIVSKPAPIVPFADWDYYYINEPLKWQAQSGDGEGLREVEVPRGFVTDLASVPRELWNYLPPTARYSYPAIIHDYLYWFQKDFTREQADAVLKLAMEELNVPTLHINAIYRAVRLAGGFAWDGNASRRISGEKRILRKFPESVKITWEFWKTQDVFEA